MNYRRLPIDILGQHWLVAVVDSHDASLVVGNDVCRGATWVGKQAIYLSNELSFDLMKRVLTHELTHAWLYATQMSVPETFDEEQVCELFAIYCESIHNMCNQLMEVMFKDEQSISI